MSEQTPEKTESDQPKQEAAPQSEVNVEVNNEAPSKDE